MAVLGVASITPAFPRMAEELNISIRSIGLLITVFTFPGIILAPLFGVLADRYGRKRILVPSLFLFGLAGGACALARSFEMLVVLRFLQGIGGASLMSLNTTIIGDIFTGQEQRAAMGYNASVLSMGTASYPLIGGALATFAWYYPFYLPLAAIGIGLVVLFRLNNPEPSNREHLGSYFRNVWRRIDSQIAGIFLGSFLTFVILYGSYLTFFPFLIKTRFEGTPFIIGLLMSSMSLTTAVTSSQFGRLGRLFSQKQLLIVGSVLYIFALSLMPLMPSLWLLVLPAMIFGMAQGTNIPNLQALLASLAPMEYRAAFMSANATVLRLGQTLGPLLFGLAIAGIGMNGVFWLGAGVAVILLVDVMVLIRKVDHPAGTPIRQ